MIFPTGSVLRRVQERTGMAEPSGFMQRLSEQNGTAYGAIAIYGPDEKLPKEFRPVPRSLGAAAMDESVAEPDM